MFKKLIMASIFLFAAVAARAGGLVSPTTASISLNSAALRCEEILKAQNGVVEFLIPWKADGLAMDFGEYEIERFSSRLVQFRDESAYAEKRAALETKMKALRAAASALEARIAMFSAIPDDFSRESIAAIEGNAGAALPKMLEQLGLMRDEMKSLAQELDSEKQAPAFAQKISVFLAGAGDKTIKASYNYILPEAGWRPLYRFNALPEKGEVELALGAEIWQYSGADWRGTEIVLANGSSGPLKPAKPAAWRIGSFEASNSKSAPMLMNDAAVAKSAEPAPKARGVEASQDGVYASWKLPERFLPEGKYETRLLKQMVKTPLRWLARPGERRSLAWLRADCEMPEGLAWPSGQAVYFVNGESVGKGNFTPFQKELFFGQDPRVLVEGRLDSRQRGETGFVAVNNAWNWKWVYAIKNNHKKPVDVKVERPLPEILDKKIEFRCENEPKANESLKERLYWWNLLVPPGGEREIRHDVFIEAPTNVNLRPYMP